MSKVGERLNLLSATQNAQKGCSEDCSREKAAEQALAGAKKHKIYAAEEAKVQQALLAYQRVLSEEQIEAKATESKWFT